MKTFIGNVSVSDKIEKYNLDDKLFQYSLIMEYDDHVCSISFVAKTEEELIDRIISPDGGIVVAWRNLLQDKGIIDMYGNKVINNTEKI